MLYNLVMTEIHCAQECVLVISYGKQGETKVEQNDTEDN